MAHSTTPPTALAQQGPATTRAAAVRPAAHAGFIPVSWLFMFAGVLAYAGLLRLMPELGDLERPGPVDAETVWRFAGFQLAAGFAFLPIVLMIRETSPTRFLLIAVAIIGLTARAAHIGAVPIIEDDFFRYLVDGFVSLHGQNPFAVAPQDLLKSDGAALGLAPLSDAAKATIEGVNHPHVRSIYPLTAQAGFVAAALIEPWSLDAWRAVMIATDVGVFLLLVRLLGLLGRSPLWAAVYWLNPLVLHQVGNLGHMEPLLALTLLAAALFALTDRPRLSAVMLVLATGVKVWPAFLLPLFWVRWGAMNGPGKQSLAIFILGLAALIAPVALAPLDMTNGFAAYGTHWINTAPVFDAYRNGVGVLLREAGVTDGHLVNVISRVLLWGGVALFALGLAFMAPDRRGTRPRERNAEFLERCFLFAVVVFLASPAKLPWYALWFLALLPLVRSRWLIIATPVLAIYYLNFALQEGLTVSSAQSWIAWPAILPIWLAAAIHLLGWLGKSGQRS